MKRERWSVRSPIRPLDKRDTFMTNGGYIWPENAGCRCDVMRYQRLHEGHSSGWLRMALCYPVGCWRQGPSSGFFLHSSVSSVGVSGTRLSCLIKQQGASIFSLDATPPPFSATLSLRRLLFLFFMSGLLAPRIVTCFIPTCFVNYNVFSLIWSSGDLVFFGK